MNDSSSCRIHRAALLLAAAVIALAATAARAETLEEVIDKSVKAQGGREALTGLKSVERKGKVAVDGTFGQMEGTVEEAIIPWKKARRALDLAVFVQKDGWNGTVAWRDGMQGVQELEGEEGTQIKQAADLNPLMMLKARDVPAEKLEDETVDDVAYFVVQISPKDRPKIKLFVDKTSGEVRRISLKQMNPQFGEVEVTMEHMDYKEFGPIKLPTKTKVQLGELLQIETTFEETKVNGAVDETIFDKPQSAAK